MHPAKAQREIERLRGFRNRPEPGVALASLVGEAQKELMRRRRAVGGISAAWAELAPAELAAGAELVGQRGGVLTVRVADASARFGLDRWLRGGGLAALRARSRAALRSVRFVV